jgi:hypothetical protein
MENSRLLVARRGCSWLSPYWSAKSMEYGRAAPALAALIAVQLGLAACTGADFAHFLSGGPADKEAEKHRLDQRASEELLASAQSVALKDDCVRTGLTTGYVIACAAHRAARDEN